MTVVMTTARTVLLSIGKEEFNTFFSAAPEALADFEVKLARYDVQLRSILYHPAGLKIFSDFCKSEFSEENLEFWRACRDFRHIALSLERDPSKAADAYVTALSLHRTRSHTA